jgi:hypothetical protein
VVGARPVGSGVRRSGAAEQTPDVFSGVVVMTNEATTDGDRGPPRPTRSTFYRHKQQQAERMKIRVGRAPRRGRGAAPSRGPFGRFAACCSLPQKVERIGRKADGAQDLCAQLTPAERPGRPPNHPRHPAPAPTAQPQTDRRSLAACMRLGWGELCLHLDSQIAQPLVRRKLGPRARAGQSRSPASSVGRVMGDSVDGGGPAPRCCGRSVTHVTHTCDSARHPGHMQRGLVTFRPYIRRFVTNPPRDGAACS